MKLDVERTRQIPVSTFIKHECIGFGRINKVIGIQSRQQFPIQKQVINSCGNWPSVNVGSCNHGTRTATEG